MRLASSAENSTPAMLPRGQHGRGDRFESLLARQRSCIEDANQKLREQCVRADFSRILKAVEDHIVIVLVARANAATVQLRILHAALRLQISKRSDRETGLDDIHAERFQLQSYAYLFRWGRENRVPARRPQRGIEDAYKVHESGILLSYAFHLITAVESDLPSVWQRHNFLLYGDKAVHVFLTVAREP